MVFKILKLFGIDLAFRIASTQVDVEERFNLAKDSLEQAARTAAILALLFFLAGAAALSAFGVGLIALYSWTSNTYGEFYGFAAVNAILLFIASVMFASAISKTRSWPDESARRIAAKKLELAQVRPDRVAVAREAIEGPAPPPPPQSSEAGGASDLIEPLVWALSSTIKLPAMDNPAIEKVFGHLKNSAQGIADETVDGLARAVRHGDRTQMLAALGGALFVGWFLGSQSRRKADIVEVQ